MKVLLQMLIAMFAGAFIGGSLAVQYGLNVILSAVIGAVVACVICKPKEIIVAVPIAFAEATRAANLTMSTPVDWPKMKHLAAVSVMSGLSLSFGFVPYVVLPDALLPDTICGVYVPDNQLIAFMGAIFLLSMSAYFYLSVTYLAVSILKGNNLPEEEKVSYMYKTFPPLAFILFCRFMIPQLFLKSLSFVSYIARAIKATPQFLLNLASKTWIFVEVFTLSTFHQVYSLGLLWVMVMAAGGTFIGWRTGDPLMGAVIATAIGGLMLALGHFLEPTYIARKKTV